MRSVDLMDILQTLAEEGYDSLLVDLGNFINFLYDEGSVEEADIISEMYADEDDEEDEESEDEEEEPKPKKKSKRS